MGALEESQYKRMNLAKQSSPRKKKRVFYCGAEFGGN